MAAEPTSGARPARVVIVGAGFAGLYAARALGHAAIDLTVIDRRNHHTFQPLLYQVAAAALNPSDIAAPVRHILRKQANATVILGEVASIDSAARRLGLGDGGELGYDFLILATGATHSYFGHDEWERHAPGLKSIEDALEIRRRILLAYEAAERSDETALRSEWLTFVIVGGGPTGVELAGSFSEVARHTLSRDFRRIDPSAARVILIEGRERVLPGYPEELSAKAADQLRALGVEVRTGSEIVGIGSRGVALRARGEGASGEVERDVERIGARTVIWAAGVRASSLGAALAVPLDRAGRVRVRPDLTIEGHPEVFVIGDLAAIEQDGKPVPGVCPAAIQQGRHAAANLLRALDGRPLTPFRYVDKGSLATIGRAAAVADFGRLRLSGPIAWLAWLGVHIFFLIGFRNRVMVLLQWAWSYLTFERGARLITGDPPAVPDDAGPPDVR